MTLKDDEFGLTRNREGIIDGITISVKTLKLWMGHYNKISNKYHKKGRLDLSLYYAGRRDILTDILKCLEYDD